MPRELQAASSLPSQNNGAIVGGQASMGRSLGLAVARWVGRWHPRSAVSSSTQVGGERWQKQGQPGRRNSILACPPALLSNLAPTNLSGCKMQPGGHQHRAASRHRQHCQPPAGSPAASAALSPCATEGPQQEEPQFFSPQSHVSGAGASAGTDSSWET